MDSSPQHDQFVERFVRSQDRIYAYVATLLPNRADAEEVFQQTSLILWKKWQQFDPSRDFVRWACGMPTGNSATSCVNRRTGAAST
jgi:RNA polymerase sigma-70 factor (ECF subfamily)